MEALKANLKLKWNSDSNVLAVLYPEKTQLWTMSNYHYYLKQELVFPEPASPTIVCAWHPERPLALALSTPGKLSGVGVCFC
jgi:elongator complex protein 1